MKNFTSRMASLLLLCGALFTSTTAKAVVEEYDFSTFAVNTLGLYNYNGANRALTLSESSDFQVSGANMYVVKDYSDGTNSMKFNGRFAVQSGDIKFRSGARTSGINNNVGWQNAQGKANRYFSILNLGANDKVTVVFNGTDLSFVSTNVTSNGSSVEAGSNAVSGSEYIVSEAGRVDFSLAAWGYIYSVTIESTSETISTPTYSLSSADGKARLVTISAGISNTGSDVTTYYTIDGTEPTTSSASFTGDSQVIKIGEGAIEASDVTIKAMSKSSGAQSETASQAFAVGTTVSLAPVTVALAEVREVDGIYHPVYSIYNDNSAVLGNPVSELTVTFAGSPVELIDGKYVVLSEGEINVVATADGYESSQNTTQVENAVYDRVRFVDFTSFTADDLTETQDTKAWSKAINGGDAWTYLLTDSKASLVEGCVFGNMYLVTTQDGMTAYGIGTRGQTTSTITLSLNQGELVEFPSANGMATLYHFYTIGSENIVIPQWSILSSMAVYAPNNAGKVAFKLGNATDSYASFVPARDADFEASGVKAYIVTEITEDEVVMKEVKTAKAGTPVLLKGTKDDVVTIQVAEAAADAEGNLLKAATGEGVGSAYVLSYVDDEWAFRSYTGETLSAGKVYLAAPAEVKAEALGLQIGTATAIKTLAAPAAKGAIYTIAGQRVSSMKKAGLYIAGGKKVAVK